MIKTWKNYVELLPFLDTFITESILKMHRSQLNRGGHVLRAGPLQAHKVAASVWLVDLFGNKAEVWATASAGNRSFTSFHKGSWMPMRSAPPSLEDLADLVIMDLTCLRHWSALFEASSVIANKFPIILDNDWWVAREHCWGK